MMSHLHPHILLGLLLHYIAPPAFHPADVMEMLRQTLAGMLDRGMGGITTDSNTSTCAAAMVIILKIHTNAVWPGPRRVRTAARMVSSSRDQSSKGGSREEQEHSSRSDSQSRSQDIGGGCYH